MKRIWVFVALLMMLSGCGNEAPVSKEPEVQLGTVSWSLLPLIEGNRVTILETSVEPVAYIMQLERTGYPQQWDYANDERPLNFLGYTFDGAPEYDPDGVLFYAGDQAVIMNYEGELISTPDYLGFYSSTNGFMVGDYGSRMYLSADYRSAEIHNGDILEGGCGGPLGAFEYHGQLKTDIITHDVSNWGIGCSMFMFYDVDVERDFSSKPMTTADNYGKRLFAMMADRHITENSLYNTSLWDEQLQKVGEIMVENIGQYPISFTNGFILMYRYDKGGFDFYSFDEKKYITDNGFVQTHPFVEHYASVMNQDEKWAFIDESGNLITDYIWDSVSTPYDGKVFVERNGHVGILDLKASLEADEHLSLSDCYGSEDEGEIKAAIEKLQNEKPLTVSEEIDQAIKSLNAGKSDTAAKEDGSAIGKVTYAAVMNIRNAPSTAAEKVDKTPDKETTYEVYEIVNADGYTWYRIGEDRWIANNGSWGVYEAY